MLKTVSRTCFLHSFNLLFASRAQQYKIRQRHSGLQQPPLLVTHLLQLVGATTLCPAELTQESLICLKMLLNGIASGQQCNKQTEKNAKFSLLVYTKDFCFNTCSSPSLHPTSINTNSQLCSTSHLSQVEEFE